MKKINLKKIYKHILIIIFITYVAYTFVMQQKTLNLYKEEIEIATDEQEKLKETKKNINSDKYIEQIAREKLNMYLPNERVYIDIGN